MGEVELLGNSILTLSFKMGIPVTSTGCYIEYNFPTDYRYNDNLDDYSGS